ncbi:MAG: zinc-binding dehydrogenase [Caldilineaceae bacterium]
MTTRGRVVVTLGQNFEIREYAVPDPAPGTLLIKQELAGICGTDLHNWQKGIQKETLLGHEAVGIIAALGQGVTVDYLGNPIREGDRIVFHPRNGGVAYGFRGSDEPFTGGFADYLYLKDPVNCFIKSKAPPEVGVLAEPFTVGVHAALRANVQLGDTVIVQGAGAIGLMCMVAAKLSGAARLIVIGGPPARLELAKKLGAHVTIDIGQVRDAAERKALALAATPGQAGADVVFEAAGFLPAFPEGLELVKQDGTFAEVGHFVDIGTVAVNPNRHFLRSNLRLEGIWGSRYQHFVRAVAIMENQEVPFQEMVSHVMPLERVGDGFAALNGNYELDGKTAFKIAVRA